MDDIPTVNFALTREGFVAVLINDVSSEKKTMLMTVVMVVYRTEVPFRSPFSLFQFCSYLIFR